MRRILVDYARVICAKSEAEQRSKPLNEALVFPEHSQELVKLDEALERLPNSMPAKAELWSCAFLVD
jgi:hypothetical protein